MNAEELHAKIRAANDAVQDMSATVDSLSRLLREAGLALEVSDPNAGVAYTLPDSHPAPLNRAQRRAKRSRR